MFVVIFYFIICCYYCCISLLLLWMICFYFFPILQFCVIIDLITCGAQTIIELLLPHALQIHFFLLSIYCSLFCFVIVFILLFISIQFSISCLISPFALWKLLVVVKYNKNYLWNLKDFLWQIKIKILLSYKLFVCILSHLHASLWIRYLIN